jgi:chromosome segregation ATPase
VVSSSTDEIRALSVELESRSAMAEKAEAERIEINCKVSEYREEIQRNNNTIREFEIASKRQCTESNRLETDLERSKSQLEQKDEDLRQAMTSLAGERLATRTDMGALQTRITQLEQERIETVWQLAGKREESLSMAREIQQLNENILDMKSKAR